ncbi:hypothetical protein MJD09_10610 [bacterium]|nr:hypothetical protein [bacterium]
MVRKSPRLAKKPVINASAPDSAIGALFEKHQQSIQGCWTSLVATEENEAVSALDLLSQQLKTAALEYDYLSDSVLSVDLGDCSHRVPALLINAGTIPRAANHRPVVRDPQFLSSRIHSVIGLGVSMLLEDLSAEIPTGARILFFSDSNQTGLEEQSHKIASHVRALYGLDFNFSLPSGTIGLKTGPIFSSQSSFDLFLTCDNSVPADLCTPEHLIQAAARLSIALHQAGSRQIDPLTPVSVTVSSINTDEDSTAGRPSVRLKGGFRSMDESLNDQIKTMIQSTIEGVIGYRGLQHRLKLKQNTPVVYNDRRMQEKLVETAINFLGANAVRRLQYQGDEDDYLALFYRLIPGIVLQLGLTDMEAFSSENSKKSWVELRPTIAAAVKILSSALIQDTCGA